MLSPHELKNKEFTKAMRGYSAIEVDEHINFIIEKYTELYRANNELERKIQVLETDLKSYKSDEESIRSTLINAQKASAKIISEANERADVIIRSAKTNCEKIIVEFKDQIKNEQILLHKLREAVAQLKNGLFEQYRSHIEYIENISAEVNDNELLISDEEYSKYIVSRMKKDIIAGNVQEYDGNLNNIKKEISESAGPFNTADNKTYMKTDAEEEDKEENNSREDEEQDERSDLDIDEVIETIPPEHNKNNIMSAEKINGIKNNYNRNQKFEDEEIAAVKPPPQINETNNNAKPLTIKDRIREINKKLELEENNNSFASNKNIKSGNENESEKYNKWSKPNNAEKVIENTENEANEDNSENDDKEYFEFINNITKNKPGKNKPNRVVNGTDETDSL